MRLPPAFWLLSAGAALLSKAEVTPVTDDPTLAGPPTFSLANPGVGTTDDPEAMESSMGTYVVHLTRGRRLQTVEWLPGRHSEAPTAQPHEPVEWDVVVPWGAQVFSVSAGVSAARVRQFWVGWLSSGTVYMEPLDGIRTLSAALEAEEVPVFPSVMDASGAVSFYTWRFTANGAALWQRLFTKWGANDARKVMEVSGRPTFSAATSVPGLRSQHAVIGWVEHDRAQGSVMAIALIEEGRSKVWRSQAKVDHMPFPQQRMGVWASSPDTFAAAAVMVGDIARPGYRLARFTVGPELPAGGLALDQLSVRPGTLIRAAVDYHRSDSARVHCALLTSDGRLVDGDDRVIRTSVQLDNLLPIVLAGGGIFWRVRQPDGRFDLEEL
jgi:hypothetical protein